MKKSRRLGLQGKRKSQLTAWLMMLPGIILFAFFLWEPMLEGIRMSLYETKNVELVKFVGLDNFISVFGKHDFIQALINTFAYTFWSLVIGFLLPMFLALFIGETVRGRGLIRTAIYLPNILPGLAAIILWTAFFSAGPSGVLNILLGKLGIPPQTYLTRSDFVIPIIITISTWKGAGATALIYMAGMAGVNPDLYEAAALDGAGVMQRIRHILLPALSKLTGTLLILQIISVFQIMYEPMVLTYGGPDNASLSLMLLMWRYAFGGNMDFGKASAVAVVITLILLVFTAIYNFVNSRQADWD